MKLSSKHPVFLVIFVPVAILAYCLINPTGNFPLNDDWAWSRNVENFINGRWYYTGWESLPMLPQILWGAFVTKLLGFSYSTLRFSSILLSFVELLAYFCSFRILRAKSFDAVFITILLFFNPFHLGLSNSFMSEIPFLTLIFISLCFYLKFLRDQQPVDFWVALIFCSFAALQRQFGILLGFAYAAGMLAHSQDRKSDIKLILLIATTPLLFLKLYETYLTIIDRTPYNYLSKKVELEFLFVNGPQMVVKRLLSRTTLILLYCGFFSFPFLLYKGYLNKTVLKNPITYINSLALLLCYLVFLRDTSVPFAGNMLNTTGMGPFLLKDTYILGITTPPVFGHFFQQCTTVIAIVGASVILKYFVVSCYGCFRKERDKLSSSAFLAIFLFYLMYAVTSSLFAGFYDRYVVISCAIVPYLLITISQPTKSSTVKSTLRLAPISGTICLSILAYYSIGLTHDYLSWNRSKWEALHFLNDELNIPPEQIDGGFEYNALHFFKPKIDKHLEKSWWWIHDDLYIISFSEISGYQTIKEFTYPRWMPGSENKIRASVKITPETTSISNTSEGISQDKAPSPI